MVAASMELHLWRWQRRTAVIALPLVALHVALQYLVFGTDSIAFEAVSARVRLGAYLALDLTLLAVVAAHAFLGIRGIFMDYAKTPIAARRTTTVVFIAFAAFFSYGVAALIAFL